MDRDDETDALDDRELGDWEPLFGPHTPSAEVGRWQIAMRIGPSPEYARTSRRSR